MATQKTSTKVKGLDIKSFSTTSNTKLHLLAGINRGVTPRHVTKLSASIVKMGVIRPLVLAWMSFIDGTRKLYIIDGQHLYFSILRFGCDIPYTLVDIKDKAELIETIALLNASSKSWTTMDYITAWASINPAYQTVQELHNTYDISLSQLVEILHTGSLNPTRKGGGISRIIKEGTISICNKAKAIQTLDRITDILDIIPRNDRDGNYTFISCYTEMIAGAGASYNHAKFLAYLKKNREKFLTVTQDTEEISKLLRKGV